MDKHAELLFGIVALQMNFLTKEQLIECVTSWLGQSNAEAATSSATIQSECREASGKGSRLWRSLDDIVVAKGYVKPAVRDAVLALVREQVAGCGGDAQQRVSSVRIERELKEDLLDVINNAKTHPDSEDDIKVLSKSIISAREIGAPATVIATRPPEGKYIIKEEIGKGGLGSVVLAFDNDIGRPVALKFLRGDLRADFAQRFQRESVITGRLEHPNIVPVHDIGAMACGLTPGKRSAGVPPVPECARVGEGTGTAGTAVPHSGTGGPSVPASRSAAPTGKADDAGRRDDPAAPQLYMAMKLIKGRNLGEIIFSLLERETESVKRWTLRRLIEVFHDVCQAMAFAHSKGVIHRDLKPTNIMVGEFGETLVVDWGLAKVVGEKDIFEEAFARGIRASADDIWKSGETPQLTMEGDVVGTPQYMSPEQAAGQVLEVDERSDIYSLGAILYEILTLRPPYEGKTVGEVLQKAITCKLTPPATRVASVAAETGAPRKQAESQDLGDLLRTRTVPTELQEICLKCLSKRKEDRYRSASELAEQVMLYLEGAKEQERRHELAEECGRVGRQFLVAYFDLKEKLETAKKRARESLEKTRGCEPIEKKRPAWRAEDAAKATERALVRALNDAVAKFMEGIGHESANERVRKGLCELYWDRFLSAEMRGDEMDMAYYQGLILAYGREWFRNALKGEGSLAVNVQYYACNCLLPVGTGELQVDINTDKLVECAWGSKQTREEDKTLVPELTVSLVGEPRGRTVPDGQRAQGTAQQRAQGNIAQRTRWGHSAVCVPQPLVGARVWLFRFEEKDRVLVPGLPDGVDVEPLKETAAQSVSDDPVLRGAVDEAFEPTSPYKPEKGLYLGRTPIPEFRLPMGSYLLLIAPPSAGAEAQGPIPATGLAPQAPGLESQVSDSGFAVLRCPIHVGRGQDVRQTVTMYRREEIPAGFVVVPGGEFIYGGGAGADSRSHVRNVSDFFVARYPVTCAEYLDFLNDLARTDPELAVKRAPRESEESGPYWKFEDGVFRFPPTGQRQLRGGGRTQDWRADWPAVCISWLDAVAYCRWKSGKEGRICQLPIEEEWEKAARGTDGRVYPFGKYCDGAFCNINVSHEREPMLVGVREFPHDEAPCGARGLAGNVTDWCFNDAGEKYRAWRCDRGGSWSNSAETAVSSKRFGLSPTYFCWHGGFRLVVPCRVYRDAEPRP
ncbi:MAG: bifunctional serine/threonine-protein kinase/formylglycine-generating enzyme family protein [Planctomycetota bacterium]|nr:bifunctional serine/threonine-protein kinase/formylglycine-generating enzyme family protein [Planctomycetota bacterium]